MDLLKKEKYLEVSELCNILGVSAVTIRKDLKLLEEKGLLFRTHGGASFENPYINERAINEKEKIFIEEKNRIARAAAELITPNDSIMIASGTTLHAFARIIQPKEKLNVITSSLNVVLTLLGNKNIDILQLGGYVRHSSASVAGSHSKSILESISCSKLYLGVDGLDMDYGLSTSSMEEAQLNKMMIDSAQKIIVLTDSSKFGKKSFARICSLEKIDQIITDKNIHQSMIKKTEEKGIKIIAV